LSDPGPHHLTDHQMMERADYIEIHRAGPVLVANNGRYMKPLLIRAHRFDDNSEIRAQVFI